MVNKSLVPPLAALLLLVVALALVAGSVGAGATSDVIVQACTEPPATPKQTAPPNGSTVTGSSVTLQWSAVEGATTYRLQLCGDAACSEYVGDFTTQNTSFNVPGLDTFLPEGSCVYWQVRAENDCGVSDYSPLWEICRPAPTATPTDTPGTPTATYTPGTPTATYTPGTATTTPTRTRTPTPSNTVTGSNIYGYVRDVDTDAPLQGVTISLYRGGAGNWALVNEKTTDANGYFAFSFSSVPTLHQLVESDPAGYQSDRVTFPSGFAATAVDANTVEFNPPATSTGPIIFYDKVMPTATPTNTPTNTATPTATNTPTPTPTITLTPTLSDGLTVWLPMIVNVFER